MPAVDSVLVHKLTEAMRVIHHHVNAVCAKTATTQCETTVRCLQQSMHNLQMSLAVLERGRT